MAEALQIICAALIIAAVVFFIVRNRKAQFGATTGQMILSVIQIILCGWFFALCISDILDIPVSFSPERLILMIVYALAFLALTIFTLFTQHKESSIHLRLVFFAVILLIAVQCFVFPYGTEDIVRRIFEILEGAVVFGLLVAFIFKMEDASFTGSGLVIATILEFIVAAANAFIPFASITADLQPVDVPLNYAALFMRPVLFASLTLSYRVWLNRRGVTDWISPENPFYKLSHIFIRPYSDGAELVEKKDMRTSILAIVLHVLSTGSFFYLLLIKTDGLIQNLMNWISQGAGEMLRKLTDIVIGFLHDTIVSWIGMIPDIGEALHDPAQQLVDNGITSLSGQGQIYVDAFFQDLARALRLPSLIILAGGIVMAFILVLVLFLLIWAMLKITKHKWCSFKGAFCLTAVRSTVTIPFAIVSALLACYNPLFGIILFALAIFWSMGHLYTAIMAGADRTSGNRSAAWFPPILIIMYLLTAAVMIAVIIYTGVTLYYQLSDMANFYISYFSDLFAGL